MTKADEARRRAEEREALERLQAGRLGAVARHLAHSKEDPSWKKPAESSAEGSVFHLVCAPG